MPHLQAIHYSEGHLEVLDQLALPHRKEYLPVHCVQNAWDMIRNMNVRGAPAIAIVAGLSLAVEVRGKYLELKEGGVEYFLEFLKAKVSHLQTSRPTAVNLFQMCDKILQQATESISAGLPFDLVVSKLLASLESELEHDIKTNKSIGLHGANEILLRQPSNCRILTHCNTGSLATAGYGTALGVIRSLHELKALQHVYCTETRPYNQGARLTAFELVHDHIDATLIADSMAGLLMSTVPITAVIVGADRVVRNGDTANKIGTYQLAVLAQHHQVPFYVAAPLSSIDIALCDGSQIPIEERGASELTHMNGVQIAAAGIKVWNPGFDVTPKQLIEGIITEYGVIRKTEAGEFKIAEFMESFTGKN
eukprot:Sdes_comp20425_c0_seq1m14507